MPSLIPPPSFPCRFHAVALSSREPRSWLKDMQPNGVHGCRESLHSGSHSTDCLCSQRALEDIFFSIQIFPLNKTSGGDSYCLDYDVVSLTRPRPSLVAVVNMICFRVEPIWSVHFFILPAAGECVPPAPTPSSFRVKRSRQPKTDPGGKNCNCF